MKEDKDRKSRGVPFKHRYFPQADYSGYLTRAKAK